MTAKPILWIIIPCYNEQEVLPITAPQFLQKVKDLAAAGLVSDKSRVCLSTTAAKDATWQLICSLPGRTNTISASARAATGATRPPCWPA